MRLIQAAYAGAIAHRRVLCKQWRFPPPAPAQLPSATVAVDFLLPSKLSRWHGIPANFQVLAASAPVCPNAGIQFASHGSRPRLARLPGVVLNPRFTRIAA